MGGTHALWGVSQPPRPPPVRQRAEPLAVGPAQGVRQQPPPAARLPPWRLPRGQVELLPPEGEDRCWGGEPGPPGGQLGTPRHHHLALPQGWAATGPDPASPCRSGGTPRTLLPRLSASSTISRVSRGPSGEPPPRGGPPEPPPAATDPLLPFSAGRSTGSCWSRRPPGTVPRVTVGWRGGGILGTPLGMGWAGGCCVGVRGLTGVPTPPQVPPCPRG